MAKGVVCPSQATFLRHLQVLHHTMEGYCKVSEPGVWQGDQGPELWEESPTLSPERSVLSTPEPQSLHLSSERAGLFGSLASAPLFRLLRSPESDPGPSPVTGRACPLVGPGSNAR